MVELDSGFGADGRRHSGDGLARTSLCRQDLVGEVERDAGEAAVVVLSDPLGQPLAELRVLGQQLWNSETGSRSSEQSSTAARLPRAAGRGRASARRRSRPCGGVQVALAAVLRPVRPQTALLDDVHRPGRLALRDDDLTGRDVDRLSPGDERRERLGRQRREARGIRRKVQRCVRGRPLEHLPYLRMRRASPRKTLVEAEDLHGVARAHGRVSPRLIEQPRLAEAVAAVQRVQDDLLSVLACLHDSRRPGGEDVERVGLVALAPTTAPNGNATCSKLSMTTPRAGGQQRKGRQLAEQIGWSRRCSCPPHACFESALERALDEVVVRAA